MRFPSAALACLLSATTALAQSSGVGGGGPELAGQPNKLSEPQLSAPPVASSLGSAGDLGGARAALEQAGITFSLTYTGEILSNVSGGMRRGSIHEGLLDTHFNGDLDKLLGWSGATFHTNFYQIHGRGLSRYYLGNLMAVSDIEASPTTRLDELWIEQKLFDGKVALRVGQLAADAEFLISEHAFMFVNGSFGWPEITAANLPSGGPAYPLATPGVRLQLAPTEEATVLLAVFNGDPAGPAGPFDNPDPQRRNRNGVNFRVRDPALLMVEGEYAYNHDGDAAGLPGAIKLGSWAHLGRRFEDQRLDNLGLSLADPNSTGVARRLRGDSGVYAVLDQMVYRVPGTTDQGIGVFARVSGSPGDRNLVSFYADGGITFKGLLPGRSDDIFGLGFGYTSISEHARQRDRDARLFTVSNAFDPETGGFNFTGRLPPVRSSETLLEATYQAQIVPGWTMQPDLLYVFRPGGRVPNPRDPNGALIKDAAVFGLRITIRY